MVTGSANVPRTSGPGAVLEGEYTDSIPLIDALIKANCDAICKPSFIATVWFELKPYILIDEMNILIQNILYIYAAETITSANEWVEINKIPQGLDQICFDMMQRIEIFNLGKIRKIINNLSDIPAEQLTIEVPNLRKYFCTVIKLIKKKKINLLRS